MASRDLTSAFIERRSAANLRRRTGENVGGGSRMKPFGKNTTSTTNTDVTTRSDTDRVLCLYDQFTFDTY